MTTEKQELAAGGELDALVAEKVMGGVRTDPGSYRYPEAPSRRAGVYWLPQYSTSIADAWLVVEKMREKGWVYCIVQSYPENAEEPSWDDSTMRVRWWVEFSRYRSPVEVTSPECETPALAICLAALKAVA